MYDVQQQALIDKTRKLKQEKSVYIIAHYYQHPEVQEAADFVGDSYAMALAARNCKEDTILVAGVNFMAETAAILCPDKTVLNPEPAASCPMADEVKVEDILAYRQDNPDHFIISYVNTPAEIKAVSDVCCTSSNAENIIQKLSPQKPIYFLPDRNLGEYIAGQLNRQIACYPSCCPIHEELQAEEIIRLKNIYPQAVVLAHPECNKGVRQIADFVGSTSAIIRFAEESDHTTLIIATEKGIMHRISQRCPDKNLILASDKLLCPDMKSVTLEKILHSLENHQTIVSIPEETRIKASDALNRMIQWSE